MQTSEEGAMTMKTRDRAWEELRTAGYVNVLDRESSGRIDDAMLARDSTEGAAALARAGVTAEGKPIPFIAAPYLISAPTYARWARDFSRLCAIMERLVDSYLTDEEIQRFFGFDDKYHRAIMMGAKYRPYAQYCRFDFGLDERGDARIYELNANCPAGIGTAQHMAKAFAESGVCAELARAGIARRVMPLEDPRFYPTTIMNGARAQGFLERGSRVAVVNSRHETITNELDLFVKQYEACGFPAVRAFAEDLRYEGGRLWAGEEPVDAVQTKFMLGDFPHLGCAFSSSDADVEHFLRAYADGKVFVFNSFASSYLLESKATLAFFWSALGRAWLGAEGIGVVERTVPETLLVDALGDGFVARVAEAREDWVLKRCIDTRGAGVVVGRAVTDDAWREALASAREQARARRVHYVLQRYAAPKPVCAATGAGYGDARIHSTLACLLVHGEPAGFFVRGSVDATTNVTNRAGFLQPVMVERAAGDAA